MNILPWQLQVWRQLLAEPEHLPHAVLLAGPAGLGKLVFAHAMAARLLCEAPVDEGGQVRLACGKCSSCSWFVAGNHPDFRMVQPEEADDTTGGEASEEGVPSTVMATPGKPKSAKGGAGSGGTIRIDQIRALADFVFVGSHRHGKRIVVLNPAEAMNPAAANALLKILEEPPPSVYFIMVSSSWRKLLPTIRSRCRMVVFGRPEPALASQWLSSEGVEGADGLLRLTGGAPFQAREWATQGRLDLYRKAVDVLADKPVDPVAMAARWSALIKGDDAFDQVQLVEAVQKWVFDLVQLKLAGGVRYHEAWRGRLAELAAAASSAALLACYGDLLRVRAVARHPLNAQLFLEDMAARYVRALAPTRS